MHVSRLGLTSVKGMRHAYPQRLRLSADGPVGDRVFCLVDPRTLQVVRTVDHDRLMACRAVWSPPVLTVHTPAGGACAVVSDGAAITGVYWGRQVRLTTVEGPWAGLLGRYLGLNVLLCRVATPGDVVWAGSVSVVTTTSLAELARRTGMPGDTGARFRATVVVDTGSAPAFVEDSWVGRRLRLGETVVAVRGLLSRCAVVDRRPGTGGRDGAFLAALAPDRRDEAGITFGVHGDIECAGLVAVGDTAALLE